MTIVWTSRCVAALSFAVFISPAFAQRADENAFNTAEDAFGNRVGSEGVGLYSSRDARGFDPNQAGNNRIEGLYIDQQALIGTRLARSSSIHVGISAQSYPFPAPTGIANSSFIMPGDKTIVSGAVHYSEFGGPGTVTLDVQSPLTATLGVVGGIGYAPNRSEWASPNTNAVTSWLLHWNPTNNFEAIPFVYYVQGIENIVRPQIFTAGNYLPPKYHRRTFFGQDWAKRESRDLSFGTILRGNPLPNWRVQMGLFRSDNIRPENKSVFFRNTQLSGLADLDILGSPKHRSASTSGELRASGIFTQGSYRHTVHFNLRGRDTTRIFGGIGTVSFGPAQIGVNRPVPKPTFTYGLRDRDLVRQITPGVSYVGQLARVAEFSVGVQRSYYHRDFGRDTLGFATTKSKPWLYNGTVSVTPTNKLALYASYTRGMEEFGNAPDNAANRGQPMPAGLTSQVDAGLRYRLMPGVNLVAGVFEVKKPYFDRDPTNVFTRVGDRSHQGIEASLTGQVLPGLTVVAGAVLIKARVSGSSVDSGLIGNVPPGLPPAVYSLGVQYSPASWKGFAVDSQFKHTAGQHANRLNTLRVTATMSWDVGVRYNFKINDANMNFRAQAFNVTNAYDWQVDQFSGSFAPTPPRRYSARLAADF